MIWLLMFQSFTLKEWQDMWDACQGNKLYAIYPNVDKVVHSSTANKYQVIKSTIGGYQLELGRFSKNGRSSDFM